MQPVAEALRWRLICWEALALRAFQKAVTAAQSKKEKHLGPAPALQKQELEVVAVAVVVALPRTV